MSLISVIVPVYNVEKYLNRCLDSIVNQTYKDIEIILVDDGSTDNSGAILDEYAKKDKRVKVIHKTNGGLSSARNVGIDLAFKNNDSKWLSFIDSDDWVNEHYIEYLYKAAIENNNDISICNYIKTYTDDVDQNCSYKVEKHNIEDFYVSYRICGTIAVAKLYKKELFKEIRYPLNKINEDEFVTYKILFKYENITFVNSNLYYYYQRQDSIMNKEWTIKNLDNIEAFNEQHSFFKNNNYNKAYNSTLKILLYYLAKI